MHRLSILTVGYGQIKFNGNMHFILQVGSTKLISAFLLFNIFAVESRRHDDIRLGNQF